MYKTAKKYFVPVRQKYYYEYNTFYSCILPRYYFVSTYRKAYITKIRITSPELESREKEIENKISHPDLRKYSIYYNDHHRYFDVCNRSLRLYNDRKYPGSFIQEEVDLYFVKRIE